MIERLALLVLPAVSLVVGCADDEANCLALCQPLVTFTYSSPVPGSHFEVAFSPRGTTIGCDLAANGEATCSPAPSNFHLSFGPKGLSELSWSAPPAGELRVVVTVDGANVTDESFAYQPPTSTNPCNGGCGGAASFALE
jgi:hypothetical protein